VVGVQPNTIGDRGRGAFPWSGSKFDPRNRDHDGREAGYTRQMVMQNQYSKFIYECAIFAEGVWRWDMTFNGWDDD
jgi:hypothetical protein